MSDLVVIGGGGHAKVVIATAQSLGHRVLGVYDDHAEAAVLGAPLLGRINDAVAASVPAVIAIGDNDVRAQIADALDMPWATLVHPTAHVHESVALEEGTVVFAGAIVQPDACIGRHGIINTAGTVDHDCKLGAFVHVAPGAHLCGGVTLEDGVLFGVGATAIPGVRVGAHAKVGAGAVCHRDVPSRQTVVGVPARPRYR